MSLMYETLLGLTRPASMFPYAEHVIAWNQVAVEARNGKTTPIDLQMDFVKEEFDELVTALREGDRKEVVDAICDLFVVATYAGYLSKTPSLEKCCTLYPNVTPSLVELEMQIHRKNPNHAEIIALIVAIAHRLDFGIDYNMNQVLSSNDSKYPEITDIREYYPDAECHVAALEAECERIEEASNGRYEGVTFRKVGSRVVFFDSNGKIMKPITFVKPVIIV